MSSAEGANDTDQPARRPARWASGRVLSEAQRARKREVDRNARRASKREHQQRIAELEERVRILSGNQNTQLASQLGQEIPVVAEGLGSSYNAASATGVPASSTPFGTFQQQNVTPNVTPTFQQSLPAVNDVQLTQKTVLDPAAADLGQAVHQPTHHIPAQHGSQQGWNNEGIIQVQSEAGALSRVGAPSRDGLMADGADITSMFNNLVCYIRSLDPSRICIDDARNQDFLISAVLMGWDHAISRNRPTCPLWEVLQLVDSSLFKNCNMIERLSLLRLLHRMYMFELTGWTGAPQSIPPWYKPRPVQRRFSHDPVVDHLGWPGLRERLVLEGTGILTNDFWAAFSANVKFHWTREPLEAIVFNDATGQYSLSGEFHQSVASLAHWRMKTPFFVQFPNLFDDFALEEQIPLPLIPGTPGPELHVPARHLNRLITANPTESIVESTEEEPVDTLKSLEDPVP